MHEPALSAMTLQPCATMWRRSIALIDVVPDWRITCFFVANKQRRRGVADAALHGALAEIERLGGGTVESYPEDAAGRKVSGSFLHNCTLQMFERHGFERDRQIGKHRWVVRRTVA